MIKSIDSGIGLTLSQHSRMAGEAIIAKLWVATATGCAAPITQSTRIDQPFQFFHGMVWVGRKAQVRGHDGACVLESNTEVRVGRRRLLA